MSASSAKVRDQQPGQVDGSWITAIARPVSIEPRQRQPVWEIDLKRDDGRQFCVSTLTVAVVPQARAPN
jgi:acyl-coenzyme A thioesterase PaaI-like protein